MAETAIEWTSGYEGEPGYRAAYFAGLIDGDGYISVQSRRYKGFEYFWPRVGIAGTQRAPLDLAATLWGGSVIGYSPKNPRHRVQYQWSRVSGDAVAAIKAIRPHLILKASQADFALDLWAHLQARTGPTGNPYEGWSAERRASSEAECRRLKQAIAALNQDRRTKIEPIPADLWVREWPKVAS